MNEDRLKISIDIDFDNYDANIQNLNKALERLSKMTNLKLDFNVDSTTTEKLNQINEVLNKVNQTNKSMIGSLSNSGLNMNSSIQEIQKFLKETINAKASVSSMSDSLDKFGNKIRTVNYSVNEGHNVVSKYKATLDESTGSIYNMSKGVQDLSSKHGGLAEQLSSSIKGMLQWSLAAGAVYGTVNQIKEAISSLNELNKSQVNIQMITGMNGQQVQGLTDQYANLATQLHSTNSEMLSGAENFLRAGNSIGETKNLLKATNIGAILSGQDTKTVSDQLIAMANGFKMNTSNAKEMMSVIDKLTKTDNNSASSFEEMAISMSKSADMAKSAKVDFDHLLAYESTVSSVTREEPSSIGRSFSTMFSRFLNVKGGQKFSPDGDDLSNVERDLRRYANINLRSDPKTFKSYETVIDELSDKWKNLSEVSRSAISKAFAGAENANNFQALMNNIDQVDKNLKDMGNSAGYAEEKYNNVWSKSTQAKVNDFKHSIEELYRSIGNSDEINKGIDSLNGLLKTFTSITNHFGLLPTLLSGIIPILTQFDKFKSFKPIDLVSGTGIQVFGKNLSDIKNIGKSYDSAITAVQRLNKTTGETPTILERTTATMKALRVETGLMTIANGVLRVSEIALNAAITMGISFVIGEAIGKIDEYIHKVDNLKQKNDELLQSSQQSTQEHQSNVSMLSEMSAKYSDVYDRIQSFKDQGMTPLAEDTKEYTQLNDELAQKFPDLITGYDETGHAVLDLKGNLEDLIKTEKEKAKWDSQKVINDSGFKDEAEAKIKENNNKIEYLNQTDKAGNFVHNIKTAFTDPKTYIQKFTTNDSQKAKMTAQLNKENAEATNWYKKQIPDILKIDDAYQKLNPTVQTSIRNWALQNKEFSKMNSAKDIQKQIGAVSKLYSNNDNLKVINDINKLTKQAKSGVLPLDKYTKQTDSLIKKIKQVSGTSLSANQLKKIFNIDTNKIAKDISKINSLSKSVSNYKKQFTTEVQQINKYNKILSDIQNTGKVSSANKKLIEQNPELLPYLGDVNTLVEKIQEKVGDLKADSETAFADSQIKDEQNNLENLENTYVSLASKTNLTATEKERLANTTAQLKELVPGLINVTNGDSDAIDKNKKMIDNKISSLDSEAQYIALVAQIGKSAAKQRISDEIDETNKVIKAAQDRISQYGIEANVLQNFGGILEKIPFGIGKKFKSDKTDIDYNTKLIEDAQKKSKALQAELNSEGQGDKDWDNIVSGYNKSSAAIKNNTEAAKNNAKAQDEGYDPAKNGATDANDDNTKSTDKNTKAIEDNTTTMDKAKEVAKEYELQLTSLSNVIKKQEDITENYAKGSEKRRASMQQEIALIKQEIGLFSDARSNAESVSNSSSIVANQSGTAIGKQIVTNAEKYLNTPYVWGGESPQGFDCSGLVQYVYKQVGIQLNRTSQEQYKQGTPVSKANLQPGDLVFFEPTSTGPGHVGIYAGNGKVVQSPHTGDVVKVSNLNDMINADGWVGARRIVSGSQLGAGATTSKMTYADIVNAAAQKYGVSANLIAGVIEQESAWDANAKSGAGAMGLMQLMPGTAKELGVTDAYNPYQNVMGGVSYLSRLLKKYGGNSTLALAAYNAGEGNVAKYGGVPPFSETQSYVKKVLGFTSQYANQKLSMPTTSASGTISDDQDMASKVEDYSAKIEDDTQKIHEIYKSIFEDQIAYFDNQLEQIGDSDKKIGVLQQEEKYVVSQMKNPGGIYTDAVLQEMQEKIHDLYKQDYETHVEKYDNQAKAIDSNIEKLQSMKNLDGENDNAYINNLKQTLDTTNKKISILKDEQNYINEQLKNPTGFYTDAVITEMKQKNDELANSLLSVQEAIKEAGNAWAQAKFDNITASIQTNLTLIENALNRLDNASVVDLGSKITLQAQKVQQDQQYISDLTDLLRELNSEEAKTGSAYLFDRIKDINAELDKARTTLSEDNKGIEDIKSSVSDLTSTILDKIKDVIQKNNEVYKDTLNANLKLFEDAIDKEINKLEEAKKKLDNNSTNYDDIQNIAELQRQLNAIQGGGIDSESQRQDLQKQLDEANRKLKEDTINQNIDSREDALNKAKSDYENLVQSYSDAIDKSDTDENLNIQANQSLINGYLVDSNGNKVDLDTALKNYEDKFGEGLTVLGNKIKTELIDQLKEVQDLMTEFGTLDTTKINPTENTKTVYGTGVDLQNAQAILGAKGYNYVNTNDTPADEINPQVGDVVLGNSVPANKINGATNLTGADRYKTETLIQMYADSSTGKIPAIGRYTEENIQKYIQLYGIKSTAGTVYGTGTDLGNAKKLLEKFGYKFVDTNDVSNIALTENDIVVGGSGVIKGSQKILPSNAKWLWGNDRASTLQAIENYAEKLNNIPIDTKGFSEGGTVDFTGLAMVHGTKDKPETVLNYEQGTNLHKFLTEFPNKIYNMPREVKIPYPDYSNILGDQIKNIASDNGDIVNQLKNIANNVGDVNYEFSIENLNGTKQEGESFAKGFLKYRQKKG